MTHDQCRQKICILCLEKKKSIGPISLKVRDLIKDHIPGLENFENDERLPNAICARCRQALTQSSKRHLLPEPKEYSKFTSHNEDTCYLCKLGSMDNIAAKKLASLVAAGKRGENLTLCSECLSYKAEGVTHDCKLSQLANELFEKASLFQPQVISTKSEATQGPISGI